MPETLPPLAIPRVLGFGQRVLRTPFEMAGLGLFALVGLTGLVDQVQRVFNWGIFLAIEESVDLPFSVGWSLVVLACVVLVLVSFRQSPLTGLLTERAAMVGLAVQFGGLALILAVRAEWTGLGYLLGEAVVFVLMAVACGIRATRITLDLREVRAILAAE